MGGQKIFMAIAFMTAFFTWAIIMHRRTSEATAAEDHVAMLVRQAQWLSRRPKANEATPRPQRYYSEQNPRESYRLALATIARTGNGWMRGMLEAATGIGTESVFPEAGAKLSITGDTYIKPCGWLGQCAAVRSPKKDDIHIIKTHFPFTTPRSDAESLIQNAQADIANLDYLLLAVRNPLDNYDAWVRYVKDNIENWQNQPYLDLKSFVQAWALHHNFWYAQPQPRYIYRYEDLVENPIRVTRLLLELSGIWQRSKLDEYALLRVANISQLQSYKRKQLRAQTRKKHDVSHSYKSHDAKDIRWILETFRPELERYGYDQLYETWLEAKLEDWSLTGTESKVVAIMSDTSSTTLVCSHQMVWKVE
eukprot:TRINITY_DN9320_c0_g1_i3.p1 TRINITY_DN9320_c0_g1~~TRINITY_DN9320_c0_g1_i3.p1  ORF type:complete len:365 (+),score=39.33 TRINITY_DN9320_c0_g1_i3:431-1525(+)